MDLLSMQCLQQVPTDRHIVAEAMGQVDHIGLRIVNHNLQNSEFNTPVALR